MIERLLALALILAPGFCLAQGNESTTATEDTEGGDAVQIGAGSTSAVTTGSSGPGGTEDETVQPLAPPFSIAPEQEPILGPGPLSIQSPDRLRCDVIADETARERCNGRSMQDVSESAND